MRDFLYSIKAANVVKGVYAWRQATMKAEDLVIDQGRKWKIIKEIGKVFPHICVAVFPQTFVVKAIDLCDLP